MLGTRELIALVAASVVLGALVLDWFRLRMRIRHETAIARDEAARTIRSRGVRGHPR